MKRHGRKWMLVNVIEWIGRRIMAADVGSTGGKRRDGTSP